MNKQNKRGLSRLFGIMKEEKDLEKGFKGSVGVNLNLITRLQDFRQLFTRVGDIRKNFIGKKNNF